MGPKRKSQSPHGDATKKRKTLTLEQKLEVIKQHECGKNVNSIGRDMKLSHSTVSTILKDICRAF